MEPDTGGKLRRIGRNVAERLADYLQSQCDSLGAEQRRDIDRLLFCREGMDEDEQGSILGQRQFLTVMRHAVAELEEYLMFHPNHHTMPLEQVQAALERGVDKGFAYLKGLAPETEISQEQEQEWDHMTRSLTARVKTHIEQFVTEAADRDTGIGRMLG